MTPEQLEEKYGVTKADFPRRKTDAEYEEAYGDEALKALKEERIEREVDRLVYRSDFLEFKNSLLMEVNTEHHTELDPIVCSLVRYKNEAELQAAVGDFTALLCKVARRIAERKVK